MNESRQKIADQRSLNAELNTTTQDMDRDDGDKEQNEPKPDLFRLKLVIFCMVILNLIFAFYALRSDRFVTQPHESDSEQGEIASPNPDKDHAQSVNQDLVIDPSKSGLTD